jgi:ArsR family transcriptional regulator, arsenate/arsenite/antimonite-responsive transcriptional repressor
MASMKRSTDPDVALLTGAADPTRLAFIRQMSALDAVCACDFSDCCDLSQPTVSHHLKVLRETGWVTTERRGSWIYYRLREDAVARFARLAGQLVAADDASPHRGVPGRALPVVQAVT